MTNAVKGIDKLKNKIICIIIDAFDKWLICEASKEYEKPRVLSYTKCVYAADKR